MYSDWRGYVRHLLYPVQFERELVDGAERAIDSVVLQPPTDDNLARCLAAVREALASEEPLALLIPQDHSEEAVRTFLVEIERRLTLRMPDER